MSDHLTLANRGKLDDHRTGSVALATADCGHEVDPYFTFTRCAACNTVATCDDCAPESRCYDCGQTHCKSCLTVTADGAQCADCLRAMAEDGHEERMAA